MQKIRKWPKTPFAAKSDTSGSTRLPPDAEGSPTTPVCQDGWAETVLGPPLPDAVVWKFAPNVLLQKPVAP